jgi:PAS domain S-box-containing protein
VPKKNILQPKVPISRDENTQNENIASFDTVDALKHELSVHEIELEMQNEELLTMQSKLNAFLVEYADLFDLSPICYIILDKNGIIRKLNNEGCLQLKISRNDIVGKPFSMFLNGELHQDNFYRHRLSVMETQSLQCIESEIKRKDGSIFFGMIKSAIVRDEKQLFKHFLLIINDITSIKNHEIQVELALDKANQLNALKSRFITIASHEFRTPLTSILSSVWLVNQYVMSGSVESIQNHLNKIKSSVKDLTLILDDFLSHEKLESNLVESVKENIDLQIFCKSLVEDFSISLKPSDYIHYSHLGEAKIISDKKVLYHVLSNLLSNAVKYSSKQVEVTVTSELKESSAVIKVSDNGIGIPADEQEFIFDRFFRAHNALTKQGTGLGLNIVKEYLKLINGTIIFKSEEGKGTCFWVEIPVK